MKNSSKVLSIIIVNYKSKDYLRVCLNSIKKNLPSSKFEIILINNDHQEKLEDLDGNYKIINNDRNLGFSKAVNQGINLAKNKFILLLNPDTIILDNSFWNLVKFAEKNESCGIIGPKIFKNNGQLQNSITRKPTFLTAIFEFTSIRKLFPNNSISKHFYYKNERNNRIRKVFAVSGACMLIKKGITKKIGYFDSEFFMYLEDVDFCWRANESNIDVIYLPTVEIMHLEGGSSRNPLGINEKAWTKSRAYFF
jgi:hypothetical protein